MTTTMKGNRHWKIGEMEAHLDIQGISLFYGLKLVHSDTFAYYFWYSFNWNYGSGLFDWLHGTDAKYRKDAVSTGDKHLT